MTEFEAFVVARTPALLRYAHLLSGDRAQAQDLVQGALAGAYRHWRSAAVHPDAYVRRSILNAHIKTWRRTGRHEHLVEVLPESPQAERIDELLDKQLLVAALRLLPPRQRAVLVLRFYEDLTEAQTAVSLGVSVGTVKSQTSRALARLRQVGLQREASRDR